ncbi:MAG: 50S ribosomal protein L30 [Clostridia bacterium]
MSTLKVTLTKSLIGRKDKHIATAHSLGLKKVNDFSVQPANDCTKGKLQKINYLVQVEEVK